MTERALVVDVSKVVHASMNPAERSRSLAFAAIPLSSRRRKAIREYVVLSSLPTEPFDEVVHTIEALRKCAA